MARHNLNLYKFLKIPAITILLQLTQVEVTSLPCELTWVEDSRGSIPDWALESGPGEYVARIFVTEESKWIGGKLRPSTQKMVLVDVDDNEKFYDSYFILTNPHNCIINWEPWRQNVPPEGSVLVAQGQSNDFIGRGKTDDNYVVGGTLDGQNGRLRVSHKGHQVVIEKPGKIWILTSLYPLLQGSVTDFIFDQGDMTTAYDVAVVVVVGSRVYKNDAVTKTTPETIIEEKTIVEKFILEDTAHNWQGIDELQIEFSLWCTNDVATTIKNISTVFGQKLTITKPRSFKFERRVLLDKLKYMEVCSFILIPPDGHSIGFTARAELTAPNMNLDQIKHIAVSSGRTVLSVDTRRQSVSVEVTGSLSGRFGVERRTALFVVDATHPPGQCRKLHGKPKP